VNGLTLKQLTARGLALSKTLPALAEIKAPIRSINGDLSPTDQQDSREDDR